MGQLLIGCGSSRRRIVQQPGQSDVFDDVTTMDSNPAHHPDVVWDLNTRPLPFADDSFDEIHAYEVLEHVGRQGDYLGFFAEFSDYWRILKPGGWLCGTVPMWNSKWAWGDPGHTRVFCRDTFTFLEQPTYAQVGTTVITDYRQVYRADFDFTFCREQGDSLAFVLRAVKPSRWKEP
jgi:SAM-dependent methyltransferase